jgi:YidC/Oxa1 family membrane protein insertase
LIPFLQKVKSKMDRRTLLAIGLCFLIFVGWQKYYIEPRLPKPKAAPIVEATSRATDTNAAETKLSGAKTSVSAQKRAPIEPKSIPITTSTGTAILGNGGKLFTNWQLSRYRTSLAKDANNIDLVSVTNSPTGEGELAFDIPELAYVNNVMGEIKQDGDLLTWNFEDENLKLVREIKGSSELNYVDVKITANFKTKRPKVAFLSLSSKSPDKDPEEQDRQLLYYTAETVERLHLGDVKPVMDIPGNMRWIGAQNRYFLMTFIPSLGEPRALAQSLGEKNARISLVYTIDSDQIVIPFKAYFGPKEMSALNAVDPSLEKTVDFGWFTVFAYPILKFMKWLYGIFLNWGVAIIVLTVVFKLVTFPLTFKSMKSMKKMAALQPQIKALQEKYKDDKQTLNQEMITFMRTNGYNPISGCLPMLIQMPVFFALYRVLYSSIELYQAPFYLWIKDLSLKDPYYITPVVLTAVMFAQQKLTPSTVSDPMQAKMMQWMPVFFGVLMINLPAGLTLYMLVNAVMSILQQLWINKKLNVV